MAFSVKPNAGQCKRSCAGGTQLRLVKQDADEIRARQWKEALSLGLCSIGKTAAADARAERKSVP